MADLSQGEFSPVLDDPARPEKAAKVLICAGKIYYQLLQRREELATAKIAIIRLEQYYPFPEQQLAEVIGRYPKAESWVWVQEAPENMGGWSFVHPRLEALIGKPLSYIGRKPSPSPATGFPGIYKKEQGAISDQAVGPYDAGSGVVA
jgi:2-oxoglutarate dehydrogenase E1 component